MDWIIGSDHAGFELKKALLEWFPGQGWEFHDAGAFGTDAVDYPDIAREVALGVSGGHYRGGILICGSGIGMSIAANKFPGIRAGLCLTVEMAELSRRHNDTNVLVLPGRLITTATARQIVQVWLGTPFDGGRHARRVQKIMDLENQAG